MPIRNAARISGLRAQVDERYKKLVKAMEGRPLNASESEDYGNAKELRAFSSSEARVATDDLVTILKEVKAALGKE